MFHPVQYILSERLRKAVNLVGDVVWANISEEEEVPSKRLWHKVEMTYERQGWDMIVILTPHSSDDNKFVRIFISGEWVEPTPE